MQHVPERSKVAAGFVSFTEVSAGAHRSYNEWHLFDHLPEQLPIPGVAWGQRWVLTPELRSHLVAESPLDRIHYLTLYLLSEPLDETLDAFRALGRRLRTEGRFHLQRTAHLSGPLTLRTMEAAPRVAISPAAVPYRPHTGIHVRARRIDDERGPDPQTDMAGVAGIWTFEGLGLHVTWCWLDGELESTAAALATDKDLFAGTLATVDPHGAWDWFD